MELSNSTLSKNKAWINGEWISTPRTFPVLNPANGTELASVSDCDTHHAEEAIIGAERAFHSWKKESAETRQKILLRWHQLILENASDLSKIMTLEQGKPLAEARAEVNYGASFIKWFAEEGKRVYGDTLFLLR